MNILNSKDSNGVIHLLLRKPVAYQNPSDVFICLETYIYLDPSLLSNNYSLWSYQSYHTRYKLTFQVCWKCIWKFAIHWSYVLNILKLFFLILLFFHVFTTFIWPVWYIHTLSCAKLAKVMFWIHKKINFLNICLHRNPILGDYQQNKKY